MDYGEILITPNTEMQEAVPRHSSYHHDDIDRDRLNEETQLSEMGFNKNIIRKESIFGIIITYPNRLI